MFTANEKTTFRNTTTISEDNNSWKLVCLYWFKSTTT